MGLSSHYQARELSARYFVTRVSKKFFLSEIDGFHSDPNHGVIVYEERFHPTSIL